MNTAFNGVIKSVCFIDKCGGGCVCMCRGGGGGVEVLTASLIICQKCISQ